MKKVLIAFWLVSSGVYASAQCPGCVPYDCSAQKPDGGLCDTVMIGMANHLLDEQISFYMPKQIYTTLLPGGGYVTLDKIKITGVVGLPLGLSWESNHSPANEYFPSSGDTIGCVRVCGTPLQADTFHLTVYLLADVTTPFGPVKNQSQTYSNAVVIILPDTAGGVASFSISPNITTSCDPLTLSFDAKIDGAPNPTIFNWDFGNGNTATGKTPASQTFSTPGTYPVTLTTTIMNYKITQFQISAACGYTNDIEELTTLQNPDMFFKLPLLGYQSSEKSEQSPPVNWTGLSIVVPPGADSLEIEVWDKDTGPPFGSQDDLLATAKIKLGIGTFFWSDSRGSCTSGGITISDTAGNIFSETLNVVIGAEPDVALITSAGDSICTGDSTIITVSGATGNTLTWFKDSVLIPGFTDSVLTVYASGIYRVEAVSPQGCKGITPEKTIKAITVPNVPNVYYNSANHQLYTNNSFGVAHLQWYKDGQSIPGANASTYNITSGGYYHLEFSNVLGCLTISDSVAIVFTSIMTDISVTGLQIFPNPNKGVFNVEFETEAVSNLEVSIFDQLGRKIRNEKAINLQGKYRKVFDLSQQGAGVYFIHIISGNERIIKKVVIFE